MIQQNIHLLQCHWWLPVWHVPVYKEYGLNIALTVIFHAHLINGVEHNGWTSVRNCPSITISTLIKCGLKWVSFVEISILPMIAVVWEGLNILIEQNNCLFQWNFMALSGCCQWPDAAIDLSFSTRMNHPMLLTSSRLTCYKYSWMIVYAQCNHWVH